MLTEHRVAVHGVAAAVSRRCYLYDDQDDRACRLSPTVLANHAHRGAVQASRRQAATAWQGVQPVLRELQAHCEATSAAAHATFTQQDWDWAAHTLLSRSIALPVSAAEDSPSLPTLVPGAL